MPTFRIATPYSQALWQLALDQQATDTIYRDMCLLCQVGNTNKAFTSMINNPTINHAKKCHTLIQIFKNQVHAFTLSLFRITAKRNRESLLPNIAQAFINQYHTYKGIQIAKVATTFALNEHLRDRFKNKVKNSMPCNTVNLTEYIDPTLLGGYVLKVADKQLDESLQAKLCKLKTVWKKH